MSETLDLTAPGTLWAKAVNESTTSFHLVVPKPNYTKDLLSKNPQVDPKDDLMRPWAVNFRDVGKDGLAACDLATSGRAGEIMAKLAERYDRGEPRVENVRGLYIARAREGNRIPETQVVEVKDFKLLTIPTITLKPGENSHPRTYVTVQNFKNGVKTFNVEMTVTGPVEQVELTASPAVQITAPGGQGNGRVVIPTVEGKKYTIQVAVPFSMTMQNQHVNHPYVWYGGWYQPAWTEHRQNEIWTGGDVALVATGAGPAKGVTKSIKLRAESWASGWLRKTPPVPMRHAHC